MATPQTQWLNKSIRIPPQMVDSIVEFSHAHGYTYDGEVNWGATIRALLAFALDNLNDGGLENQLRTLYQNAQAEALSRIRRSVLDTLEGSKKDY